LEYYLVTSLFNTFPIPQEGPGARETLRYAGDLVSGGWSLLIFPEGERRPSGHMGEFHPGVGLLAVKLKVPVIPVRIEGTDHVLPRGRMLPHIRGTRVSFGSALRVGNEKPERAAKLVEKAVKAL
jgi:long-chain acyl-CoA synthetase